MRYNAFDRELQMWVAACLFVGLEDTYQLLRGEMTAEQAEQFYRSAWTLGTTLQVTEEQWPATRAGSTRTGPSVPARRHRRAGPQVPGRSGGPSDGQSASAAAVSAVAEVPHRGFLAPVFRDASECGGAAAVVRMAVPNGRVRNRFLPVFVRQGGSFFCSPMCAGGSGRTSGY